MAIAPLSPLGRLSSHSINIRAVAFCACGRLARVCKSFVCALSSFRYHQMLATKQTSMSVSQTMWLPSDWVRVPYYRTSLANHAPKWPGWITNDEFFELGSMSSLLDARELRTFWYSIYYSALPRAVWTTYRQGGNLHAVTVQHFQMHTTRIWCCPNV